MVRQVRLRAACLTTPPRLKPPPPFPLALACHVISQRHQITRAPDRPIVTRRRRAAAEPVAAPPLRRRACAPRPGAAPGGGAVSRAALTACGHGRRPLSGGGQGIQASWAVVTKRAFWPSSGHGYRGFVGGTGRCIWWTDGPAGRGRGAYRACLGLQGAHRLTPVRRHGGDLGVRIGRAHRSRRWGMAGGLVQGRRPHDAATTQQRPRASLSGRVRRRAAPVCVFTRAYRQTP